MKNLKLLPGIFFLCMLFAACGGPSVCDCDRESIKENPDEELLEKCREKLGGMEMEEVLKALEKCGE